MSVRGEAALDKEDRLSDSLWLIIYVVAFIAIFWLMAIRPQQKQRKAHQALLSSLKKGDRIMTAAGIYGTVKRVQENLVEVEVAKGVAIKIARRAVAEIIKDSAEARAVAPEGTFGGRKKRSNAEIDASSSAEIDASSSDSGNPESREESEESEDVWSDNIWEKDK